MKVTTVKETKQKNYFSQENKNKQTNKKQTNTPTLCTSCKLFKSFTFRSIGKLKLAILWTNTLSSMHHETDPYTISHLNL